MIGWIGYRAITRGCYYCEAKGLRQEQLANEIGVCRKTICQIEAEEGHNTTLEIAYRLAVFF